MMLQDWISIGTSLIAIIAGGGWFVNYRANKLKASAEAFISMQDAYQETLMDSQKALQEVRAERDHYKEDRNALRQENEEMHKMYRLLQDEITAIKRQYQRDIAKLQKRLDFISPLLCGVVNCQRRKEVVVSPTEENDEVELKEEKPCLN